MVSYVEIILGGGVLGLVAAVFVMFGMFQKNASQQWETMQQMNNAQFATTVETALKLSKDSSLLGAETVGDKIADKFERITERMFPMLMQHHDVLKELRGEVKEMHEKQNTTIGERFSSVDSKLDLLLLENGKTK